MGGLPPGADQAGGDEYLYPLGHRGPPKVLPEEMQVSGKARVTGEEGGVPNWRTSERMDSRTNSLLRGRLHWTGDGALCLTPLLYLPLCDSKNAGRGENGSGVFVSEVRLPISRPLVVGESDVEATDEASPPNLPGVQPLQALQVLQDFVVSPHHKQKRGAL